MFMRDIHTDAQVIRVPEGWHYCFVLYHDIICPQTMYKKQYTHYSFLTKCLTMGAAPMHNVEEL